MFESPRSRWFLGVAATVAVSAWVGAFAWERRRVLAADPFYDPLTEVRASTVPGAGLGAFAARTIPAGAVVAVPFGRLTRGGAGVGSEYLLDLPACALDDAWPFLALDAKEGGGPGARINFAPRTLNGVATGFQNVELAGFCEAPYFAFVTLRAVATGEELFTSYGPAYDYGFMASPGVRDHFCRRAGLDCTERYDWTP